MVLPGALFNKTERMEKRKRLDGVLGGEGFEYRDGQPYFHGRHVITHKTPILGGVCLGEGEREAIVVDPNGAKLQELYSKAKKLAYDKEKGRIRRSWVLNAVFDVTRNALEYDDEKVEQLTKNYAHDKEVPLDKFIASGVGICRHQALAAGALLEMFKRDGVLRGEVRIHRNTIRGVGGHTWVHYTSHDGTPVILDVAQNYRGAPTSGKWTYLPPKD